jgi:hypothetical protein
LPRYNGNVAASATVFSDADEAVLGTRDITHDHQAEQPFTRTLDGVTIPEGVTSIIVEGRDKANGWGGQAWEVLVPADR